MFARKLDLPSLSVSALVFLPALLVLLFFFNQAPAAEAQAQTVPSTPKGIDYVGQCSLKTLKGTYGVLEQGTVMVQLPGFPPPPGLVAISGVRTYDGAGKLSGSFMASYNGAVVPGTVTGTYSVEPDCTYSDEIILSVPGIAVHRAGTISGIGIFRELHYDTDAGLAMVGTVKRILRSPCSVPTLRGTYAVSDPGAPEETLRFSPLTFPSAHNGTVTFDGAGNFSAKHTGSLNDAIATETLKGKYAVNPDCTFSTEVSLPDGHVSHGAGTITGMGPYQEVHIITDAGWVFTNALIHPKSLHRSLPGSGIFGTVSPDGSAASDPTPSLTIGGGGVLSNPEIHNLFLDSSWDSDNPFSEASINDFTQNLVNSNYLTPASQYGVGSASFTGSDDTNVAWILNGCVPPIVFGTTDFLSLAGWIQCMTVPDPIPFAPPLTGIPAPDDNTLYVLYLPTGTTVQDIVKETCNDFGAYHFWSEQLTWQLVGPCPLCVPALANQTFAYAVVDADCAQGGSLSDLEVLATHEIVEGATDPVVGTGWTDINTYGLSEDLVIKGEAADICSAIGAVPTPPVTMTDGVTVATYWSDNDAACVPMSADVAITKTGSSFFGSKAVAGSNFTYTINVTNSGPNTATNVVVTDTIPPGVTLVSSSIACSNASGTLTCALGNLAKGASSSFTVTVFLPSSGVGSTTITNNASVTSGTLDLNLTNNTFSLTTPVIFVADLAITKTAAPNPVAAGTPLTYTISVKNLGPSDAAGVVVTDMLPAGVTFASSSISCTGTPLSCGLGTLTAGASTSFKIAVNIPANFLSSKLLNTANITNTATVTSAATDPNLSNNTASVLTTVIAVADMDLNVSAAPNPVHEGSTLTYTMSFKNLGPSDATFGTILQYFPGGFQFVGSTIYNCRSGTSTVLCQLGNVVPAGFGLTFKVKYKIPTNFLGSSISKNVISQIGASSQAIDPDPPDGTNHVTTTVIR
jgi:uncharacterized repeat protein (TIGR01451 family)